MVFMSASEVPKNGDPPSVWEAFGESLNAKMQLATRAHQQAQALYQDEAAKGVPPAQIYADLLKQQLSQSDNTLATQGSSARDVRDTLQARLIYLQQAMTAAGTGTGTGTTLTTA